MSLSCHRAASWQTQLDSVVVHRASFQAWPGVTSTNKSNPAGHAACVVRRLVRRRPPRQRDVPMPGAKT